MSKGQHKVRIFSALEVANLCGVVNQTAINWIRHGHLKAFTTPGGQYRIYTEDLCDFLASRGMKIPVELAQELQSNIDHNTILIVDDDSSINDMLKRLIGKNMPEKNIYQAFDGFEAGAMLTEHKPGFVILDIDLPGINGFKICHRIKTDTSFGKPFVIAITGMDEESSKEKILSAGADAYFHKPLDLDALIDLIKDFEGKLR